MLCKKILFYFVEYENFISNFLIEMIDTVDIQEGLILMVVLIY